MSQLSQKEKQLYSKYFHEADTDGNGYITLDEMAAMCDKMGFNMNRDQVVELFFSVDTDCNYKITLDEFLTSMPKVFKSQKWLADIRRLFRDIDRDGNGLLDAEELMEVLTRSGRYVTMSDVKALIAQVDINGDGQLDFDEFKQLFT